MERHIGLPYVPPRVVERPVHYTETTIFKVYDSLRAAGLNEEQARSCISDMQKKGLVFREYVPVDLQLPTTTYREGGTTRG